MSVEPAIEVSGLTKSYGTRTVVDDVSFTVQPRMITGFRVLRTEITYP